MKTTDVLDLAPNELQIAYDSLSDEAREAFLTHVLGGTSAAWLSDWSSRAEVPVSPTTIRAFRERLNAHGIRA